jgi:predicted nucleotidyltransferase
MYGRLWNCAVTKPKSDFLALLKTLLTHKVDFIVVGGVCAVLHGAPISTFDLDLVHSRMPSNIERLMTALESLDAHYRGRGRQKVRPGVSHLSSPGHQLLMTEAGPLDLLGVIGKSHGYDELLAHTIEMEIGSGLTIHLLDLQTLIKIKKETARDKDKAVLAILRRTLEEKSKT